MFSMIRLKENTIKEKAWLDRRLALQGTGVKRAIKIANGEKTEIKDCVS